MNHPLRHHARVSPPAPRGSNSTLSLLRLARGVMLLATLLWGFAAHAQPNARDKPPPVEITRVQFGWDGSMPAERFAPVTVWLTSEQPFAGELSIQYKQDATQSVRYVIPVATTPGKAVPFELAAALPKHCEEILIHITDGRYQAEQWHRQFSQGDTKDLPQITDGVVNVLLIGDLSAKSAFAGPNTFDLTPASDASADKAPAADTSESEEQSPAALPLWKTARAVRLPPADLPRNWIAYQSLDAVALNAIDIARIDPRASDALLTWLDSGGRLIVVANAPGNEWRRFLSPGPTGECISLAENTRQPLNESLRTSIRASLKGESDTPYNVSVRPITLTARGRSEGWITLWELAPQVPEQPSIAAIGPRGFGMVAILGADPRNMAPVLSLNAERSLWRDLIEQLLPAYTRNAKYDQYNWSGPFNSSRANAALNSALDSVTVAEPIGAGVFILIAAAMALLVVMVGPFDGLVIRRREWGGKSWLFAVLWIGIASAAAYLAPTLSRSGQTLLSRLTLTQTLCGEDGLPLTSVTSGFTGVFGGKPARPALGGTGPGAWWKGVSAVDFQSGPGRAFAPLTAPIRSTVADSDLRSAVPVSLAQGQWTFRTLADFSPALSDPSQVGARIARAGDGWDLTLFNVPASARIGAAELLVGGDLLRFTGDITQSGSLRRVHAKTPVEEVDRRWLLPLSPYAWQRPTQPQAPPRLHTFEADLPHSLPGCRELIAAADARVFRGEYATLFLELIDAPCDIALGNLPNVTASGRRLLRIVTPIPPGDVSHIRRPTPEQLAENDREIAPDTSGVYIPPPPPPPPPPAPSPG